MTISKNPRKLKISVPWPEDALRVNVIPSGRPNCWSVSPKVCGAGMMLELGT